MSKRSSAARSKDCVVFLTHHRRPNAMASLDKLRQDCEAQDVFALFDLTHAALDIGGIPNAVGVTCPQVAQALPYPAKHQQHPGTFWPRNIDLPLLWFFQQHPGYEHYWLTEYDVRFTGDWNTLFGHFAASASDLLATTVFDYGFRPKWGHWLTLQSPLPIPLESRTRATHSFFRISRRALEALHEGYCEGWSGHYEVAIPTLLKHGGFTVEDIGGD